MRSSSVVLLLIATTRILAAQSQPPTPSSGNPNRTNQEQAREQGNLTPSVPRVTQSPTPLNVSVAPTVIANNPTTEQKADRWGTYPDWGMVGLTLATAVFTAILVVIARYQFRTQARQTTLALKLTRAGLSETRKANRESSRIADLSAEASIKSTRAFLYVTGVEIREAYSTPVIVVSFRNAGRLPASIFQQAVYYLIDKPLPTTRGQLRCYPVGAVAGPGQEVASTTDREVSFSPSDWAQIRIGKMTLAIYGVVRYQTGIEGIEGETGFGFNYDSMSDHRPAHQRFAATNLNGYNYSR